MVKTVFFGLSGLVCLTLLSCGGEDNAAGIAAVPETISYNFHVRPLLSDKCFACHGPDANKRESGLRLDIEAEAKAPLKDAPGKYAIVAGSPEKSLLIERITTPDSTLIMPPPEAHLGALNESEVALLRKWIAQGAKYEPHWAFVQPQKTKLPEVNNERWNQQPIDKFLFTAMGQKGLEPNEEASPEVLLRRLALDLTGLPPSAQLQQFYLANPDERYEVLVDSLLASPHFGERMAIHWCDVARYADSYGYQDDNIRTQWPWRDWVIHAFNSNMPYNRFVEWQIAGDLLPNATKEQVLATAFFRNHKYTEEGGVIDEEYRVEYIVDKVKTYTKGMLALTVECAQCHDHKYDPISQKDYYSMFAFFNNTPEKGYEGDVSQSKPAKTPVLPITQMERGSLLKFINSPDTGMLTVSVLGENENPRPTFILNRGVYDQPGAPVQAAALPTVLPFDTTKYPRNRLGLAKWTANRENPITARVWVNRVWQELFGRGLVKTGGDFGMQGSLPSHPELLDWLAVDFMENGWDTKRLIKQMVLSAAYRQSSKVTEEKLKADPENVYLSRSTRIRLKAEVIRDWVLASSGLLHRDIGGPSVKPYQPEGLWEAATSGRGVLATYIQDMGPSLYRRGLYTFIKLTVPPPSMVIFDASNRDQCEVERIKTNTPLQALVMMNDPTVQEAARVLAAGLVNQKLNMEQRLELAFTQITLRKPTGKEIAGLEAYTQKQLEQFKAGKLNALKTLQVGMAPLPPAAQQAEVAAYMKTIVLLYNLDETITKN
ncbi:MAG: PSD1 and planctomycete cytochrome C domain-containing protein [Chitinophagaceae bacterium]|jgi:hypothetical protein|nr:PSD1 and planctomycete cytochrome C domain-containing protein [Chitinophagaceae bacterium]